QISSLQEFTTENTEKNEASHKKAQEAQKGLTCLPDFLNPVLVPFVHFRGYSSCSSSVSSVVQSIALRVLRRLSSTSQLHSASPSSCRPAWSSPARHAPRRNRRHTADPGSSEIRKSVLTRTSLRHQRDHKSPDSRAWWPGRIRPPRNTLRPSH